MRHRFGPRTLAAALLTLALGVAPAAAETDPPRPPEPPPPSSAEVFDDEAFDDEFDAAFDLAPTPDPLEPMNRAFFRFNGWLDSYFWRPVTRSYRFLVPDPGRRAIRRAFLNFNSPPVFANDVLQLRFDDAGVTLGRFVLNSTVGMGGLFDAGIEAGWKYHDSDFGETLALYGAPRGPYLVLPIFGPSTVRDAFGDIVDRLFEPLTYIFGVGLLGSSIQVVIGTGSGITTYEAHLDQLRELEKGSIDYYSALRSVYLQSREAAIREVVRDSLLSSARSYQSSTALP